MRFDWDEHKNASNKKKHRIKFEDAITVFDDSFALIAPDLKHSTTNETKRWIIGAADTGVIVVVFTIRESTTYRIISARRANRKERKKYEESKGIPF
jgi:uncharacterized DUF497 family protein